VLPKPPRLTDEDDEDDEDVDEPEEPEDPVRYDVPELVER